MEKALSYTILGLMLILSIGFISANTLVTGITYNSDFSEKLPDVLVTINCDVDSTPLYTYSGNGTNFSQGIYEIEFYANCTYITLTATKGSLTKTETADLSQNQIHECNKSNDEGCDFFVVLNPNLAEPPTTTTTTSSGGGGSSRRYYLCGNGVCDSGETATTCATDCAVENNLIELSTSNNEEQENPEENSEDINSDNQRGITGAVIGTVTSKGGIITIIALVVLVAGFFTIKKLRVKKH